MKGHITTIKDIARQLNISPSTVSRALKNHPDLSADTKKAVQELATKLHYKPNKIALSLVQNTSRTIGMIVPELVHFFFSSVISGVQDVAYKAGYSVILCQSNESVEREVDNVQALLSSMVDGILVSISKETREYSHFNEIVNNRIPLVFFDRVCDELQTDRVVINDYLGGYIATEHLLSVGCKRIVHLAAPQHLMIGRNRFNGYQHALRKYKIHLNPDWVIPCDTYEDAFAKVPALFDSPNPPDGIFAVNDSTAIGAMMAIKKIGINVPQDVAIVGFTNSLISTVTHPSLTTIDQHGEELGKIAAQQLLKRINNPETDFEPEIKVVKPTLVVRESSDRLNNLTI